MAVTASMLSVVGCNTTEAPDLVVHGGHVITIDEQQPETSAFAVLDGVFVAVGSDEEMLALASNRTELRDLGGRTVVPGFNDAHLHSVMFPPEAVSLWDATTVDQLVERLQDAVAMRADVWVIGIGYDDTALGRHLTREDLDRVSTEHPVMAVHGSLHVVAVNSRALENADLPRPLVDPEGGTFFRDDSGEPTGLLTERPALNLLFNEQQPSAFVSDLSSALSGLEHFYRRCLSLGITSFGDAMVPRDLAFAYLLSRPEARGIRVNLMLDGEDLDGARSIARLDDLLSYLGWSPFSNDWLRAKTIKLFHGMSLSGRTTRQYEHYHGRPDYFGLEPQRDQAELDRLVEEVDEMGLQAAIHANGDYEIDMVLDAIEKATDGDGRDHRHRIEHGSIVNDSILRRMKELGVVLAPHSYIYEKGPMIEPYGEELWPRMFANASSYAYGIPNAANSDYPVAALSPMIRIQSLVTRTSRHGKTYGAEQALSVEQALHAYTMGGAYASFEEDRKGSITPGKFADFVILSADPRGVEPFAIKDIRVDATYVAGQLRFGVAPDRSPSRRQEPR
jgi:predicted amidohydrolase YtcJ